MPGIDPVSLTDVLNTGDLGKRPVRPIQSSFMNSVIVDLEYQIEEDPLHCLQKLASAAIELTGAQSAGVSTLEHNESESAFRWCSVAGQWKEYAGRSMHRHASPCGIVFGRKTLQLFSRPERYFSDLRALQPSIVEGLFFPFVDGAKVAGVVWAVFHREDSRFDAQDAFMLQELGQLAISACRRADEQRNRPSG